MRSRTIPKFLAVLGYLPLAAWAQQAYTSAQVDVYAGPQPDYPVVATLGIGTPVLVQGCVADYSWCDVTVSDLRGWVYASYLNFQYQSSWVPLATYGAVVGVPILGFALGSYWDRYYRGRPWYDERWRWEHRPPPAFVPRAPSPPAFYGRPAPAYGPGFHPGYGGGGYNPGYGPRDWNPPGNRGGYGGPNGAGGGGYGPRGGDGFRGGQPSMPQAAPNAMQGQGRPAAPAASAPMMRHGGVGGFNGGGNPGGGNPGNGGPGGGNPGGGHSGGGNPGGGGGGGNPGGGGGFHGGGGGGGGRPGR